MRDVIIFRAGKGTERRFSLIFKTSTLSLFKPEQGCHLIAISAKQSREKIEIGRNGGREDVKEREKEREAEALPHCWFINITGFSGELPK